MHNSHVNKRNFRYQESHSCLHKQESVLILHLTFQRYTMASERKHLVFGYGTLKTGQPNHGLLTDPSVGKATFVGHARTDERWPLVIATNLNIPFLLHVPGTGYVSSVSSSH